MHKHPTNHDTAQQLPQQPEQKPQYESKVDEETTVKDQSQAADAAQDERQIATITVDRHACIGAEVCAILAPGTFELDDERIAVVKDKATWDTDQVIRDAAVACPVLAIKLHGADGTQLFPEE